jgi:hypothetical protein
MSETNQNTISDTKKCFRIFAAWYAVVVPIICVSFCAVIRSSLGSALIYYCAAFILISSLVLGILSLFGSSVRGLTRGLVFVGMLISAIFGGVALFYCWLDATFGHGF